MVSSTTGTRYFGATVSSGPKHPLPPEGTDFGPRRGSSRARGGLPRQRARNCHLVGHDGVDEPGVADDGLCVRRSDSSGIRTRFRHWWLWLEPPSRSAHGPSARSRAPRAPARSSRARSEHTPASRPTRAGTARRRWSGRWAGHRWQRSARADSRSGCSRRTRQGRPRAAARVRAGGCRTSRTKAPNARPSSGGRVGESPFQNGSRPGVPGAGETST